jgi:adenylate cyclase
VVRDQVRDKLAFAFDDRGEQQVKNIARAIRSYFVQLSDRRPASVAAAPDAGQLPLPGRSSLSVLSLLWFKVCRCARSFTSTWTPIRRLGH